jgi:hypothetical protein
MSRDELRNPLATLGLAVSTLSRSLLNDDLNDLKASIERISRS